MRIAFFGTPQHAVPALEELHRRGNDVICAVTQPARGRRRNQPPVRSAVALAAENLAVPVYEPERVAELLPLFADEQVAVAAVVAYGQLIPATLIGSFDLGMVNLHFSLLPRWRGAAPVQRAILAGDSTTGVTTMLIDEGLDTGPVIDRIETRIGASETSGELTARLGMIGAGLLADSLEAIAGGRACLTVQDDSRATYAEKLTPAECELIWSQSADEVTRLVRAASPTPGAHTTFRGKRLVIRHATPCGPESSVQSPVGLAAEGGLLDLEAGELYSSTGDGGWIRLDQVVAEGRRAVSGADFARGARLDEGETLGR